MRYQGQNYEQEVALPDGPIDAAAIERAREALPVFRLTQPAAYAAVPGDGLPAGGGAPAGSGGSA